MEGDRVGPGEGTRRELSLSRKLGKMGECGLAGKDPSPIKPLWLMLNSKTLISVYLSILPVIKLKILGDFE